MTGSDERSHVKDRADLRAAAEDVALTAELATVVVEGGDARQGGGLGIGEGTEFGHERDEGRGGEQADALDLAEAIDLGEQIGRSSELCLHERFELGDLFLEEGHGLSDEAEEMFFCQGLGEIVVLSDLSEEMGAVFDQGQQLLLQRSRLEPPEFVGQLDPPPAHCFYLEQLPEPLSSYRQVEG